MRTYIILLFIVVLTLLATGCDTTKSKSKQLARVAKDWSLVIRASQVIPVYPLTEDLLPGDIFLVRTPIQEQVKEYEADGFLPMDQLIGRLQPTNYGAFYRYAYGIDTNSNTPYHWKFSGDPTKTNEITKAPRAAFPSYSFKIKRGGGLNLAVPVNGVPVGLNLLGTGSAHGDITIADAYTFGLDQASLQKLLESWVATNRNFLMPFAPTESDTNFVRIVSRVFWTGKVNISMFNDEAYGGSASGGAAKPVNLFEAKQYSASTNYGTILKLLNDSMEGASLPGGTLKLAAATSRSVSMIETFPRPLAVGFLAFDVPVLVDGKLGAPRPTQAVLTKKRIVAAADTYGPDANSKRIEQWIAVGSDNRRQLRAWLDKNGHRDVGITNLRLANEHAALRQRAIEELNIP